MGVALKRTMCVLYLNDAIGVRQHDEGKQGNEASEAISHSFAYSMLKQLWDCLHNTGGRVHMTSALRGEGVSQNGTTVRMVARN